VLAIGILRRSISPWRGTADRGSARERVFVASRDLEVQRLALALLVGLGGEHQRQGVEHVAASLTAVPLAERAISLSRQRNPIGGQTHRQVVA
jgi:outer membrane protein TolC